MDEKQKMTTDHHQEQESAPDQEQPVAQPQHDSGKEAREADMLEAIAAARALRDAQRKRVQEREHQSGQNAENEE